MFRNAYATPSALYLADNGGYVVGAICFTNLDCGVFHCDSGSGVFYHVCVVVCISPKTLTLRDDPRYSDGEFDA